MMAKKYFADENALKKDMKSEEMGAAGQKLDSFAKGLVTMFFGEEG
jgi:hypothetical protein